MGQKVNPILFRMGNAYSWRSRWFAGKKDYSNRVLEDFKLRKYLNEKLESAGLDEVVIERSLSSIKLILRVSRPGVVIGRGGANLEEIKKGVEQILGQDKIDESNKTVRVNLKVEELTHPELSAKLVAERLIGQLVARYPHRRAVSQAMEKVMSAGAKGVKIQLSGRIGGAEIGRCEKYFKGTVPTQTLRAAIDYYEQPAATRSGYVGIKVWIYKGDIQES
ncbi:MAG TPA: 30S ribosomal protein S3 [Candidatus Woesebacteria bacterium]|nr:30S ribosomal protein S3 [Candidatus Woesebacteria bacterium]